MSGTLGLGGGSIYNPCLIEMGVDVKVAGATGMYLVLFSAINSSVVSWQAGNLNFSYACLMGVLGIVGSLCGLFLADLYVMKSGRKAIFSWAICLIFLLSLVSAPLSFH